jgi:hypothetical protein
MQHGVSVAMWASKGNLKLRGLQEHNHLEMLFLYGRETFWLASLENIRKWLLLLVVYSSAAFANTSLTAQESTRIDIDIFISQCSNSPAILSSPNNLSHHVLRFGCDMSIGCILWKPSSANYR